ncbi:hypothetical protein BDR26DRAFT_1009614 [Obelidium mucronatum]|nr:hypothetical protein BDR26DRAFT_1009614 [Obelidium mucronatum]
MSQSAPFDHSEYQQRANSDSSTSSSSSLSATSNNPNHPQKDLLLDFLLGSSTAALQLQTPVPSSISTTTTSTTTTTTSLSSTVNSPSATSSSTNTTTMVPEYYKQQQQQQHHQQNQMMHPIPIPKKSASADLPPLPFFGRGTNKKQVFYIDNEDGQPPVPLRSDGSRKRVHPTKQQQELLERFFEMNPKPNSKERGEICKAVNINSRSVQVWFQNRRVKAKKEPQPKEAQSTPQSHTRQASEESSASESESPAGSVSHAFGDAFEQHPLPPVPLSSVPGVPGTCTIAVAVAELRVGTWRRVAAAAGELRCEVSLAAGAALRWTLVSGGFQFRIDVPLATISDASISPLGATAAAVFLDVCRPPLFARELLMGDAGGIGLGVKTGLFAQCGDFTEGQQASTNNRWAMEGAAADMDAFFSILTSYFESLKPAASLAQLGSGF